MTETAGGSIVAHADDPNTGHIGGSIANMKIRLRDIPEMNYFHEDPSGGNPKGEVCYKGTNIFSGYYKAPDKTAEAFDKEGWFHSGDVAEVRPDGSLRIIDRAKNIFKLVQGEYVAPEKLENIFICSKYVGFVWVYGEPTQDYVIAFIIVDPAQLAAFCEAKKLTVDEALESEELRMIVYADMMALAKEHRLNGLEKPRQIKLMSGGITVENGCLTPTFKMMRGRARNLYQAEIDKIYKMPRLNPNKIATAISKPKPKLYYSFIGGISTQATLAVSDLAGVEVEMIKVDD